MTRKLAGAVLALLLFNSCFTLGLWKHDVMDLEEEGKDGELMRILLTPIALVLDICTAPIQKQLFARDDEEFED